MRFSQPITNGVTVIFYVKVKSCVSIDQYRLLTVTWTQISVIVNKYCDSFAGAVAANELIPFLKSHFDSEHWWNRQAWHSLGLHAQDSGIEFVDSLGCSPSYYHQYWHDFLLLDREKYWYNWKQIQAPDVQTCGEFCILYIFLRSQRYRLQRIIEICDIVDVQLFVNMLQDN